MMRGQGGILTIMWHDTHGYPLACTAYVERIEDCIKQQI